MGEALDKPPGRHIREESWGTRGEHKQREQSRHPQSQEAAEGSVGPGQKGRERMQGRTICWHLERRQVLFPKHGRAVQNLGKSAEGYVLNFRERLVL